MSGSTTIIGGHTGATVGGVLDLPHGQYGAFTLNVAPGQLGDIKTVLLGIDPSLASSSVAAGYFKELTTLQTEFSQGSDTVYAGLTSVVSALFKAGIGEDGLKFVNNSANAPSIIAAAHAIDFSATVFGGAGESYWGGALSDNSSLWGGVGTSKPVTWTGSNSHFITTGSSETLTGSTLTGAINRYYFDQTASAGGGTDVITNFRYGTDHVNLHPFSSDAGLKVTSVDSATINGQASSLVHLSDNTTIKLIGVSFTAAESASIVGGTGF